MDKMGAVGNGIKSLVEHYRTAFRIPENLDHYLEEDYLDAEKRFVRYALAEGRLDLINISEQQTPVE